jgi:hypothetical protein
MAPVQARRLQRRGSLSRFIALPVAAKRFVHPIVVSALMHPFVTFSAWVRVRRI